MIIIYPFCKFFRGFITVTISSTYQLFICLHADRLRCSRSWIFDRDINFFLIFFFHFSGALSPSQFPVFTLYAQKICVRASRSRCSRSWIFDRVTGYKLEGFTKKSRQYRSREDCMASCLGTIHIFRKHKGQPQKLQQTAFFLVDLLTIIRTVRIIGRIEQVCSSENELNFLVQVVLCHAYILPYLVL